MAAARKDPVADVVTAVVIMAADVTMDVGFPLGTAPVDAIFSGSSFFFAHAAATEMAAAADLSFPHMKKGCLLSPFQKNRDSGNFPLSPFSGIF